MSDIATYLEEQVMDWATQGLDMPTAPGSLYLGAHTGDPSNDGSQNEVSTADYSRAQTDAGSDWNVTQTGGPTEVVNANEVNFGIAQNNWGTISHFSVWDGDVGTGANCLWQSALDNSKLIETDDELRFLAGDLIKQLD